MSPVFIQIHLSGLWTGLPLVNENLTAAATAARLVLQIQLLVSMDVDLLPASGILQNQLKTEKCLDKTGLQYLYNVEKTSI